MPDARHAGAAQRTPGFEVNDVGYFQGSERLDGGVRVSYREITPGCVLRSYRLTAQTSEFGPRRELGRLLGQQPDNVLILKMSCWLSL